VLREHRGDSTLEDSRQARDPSDDGHPRDIETWKLSVPLLKDVVDEIVVGRHFAMISEPTARDNHLLA
jgi:hypothetical protein